MEGLPGILSVYHLSEGSFAVYDFLGHTNLFRIVKFQTNCKNGFYGVGSAHILRSPALGAAFLSPDSFLFPLEIRFKIEMLKGL